MVCAQTNQSVLGEETNSLARPEHNACVWFLMWFGNGIVQHKSLHLSIRNTWAAECNILGKVGKATEHSGSLSEKKKHLKLLQIIY